MRAETTPGDSAPPSPDAVRRPAAEILDPACPYRYVAATSRVDGGLWHVGNAGQHVVSGQHVEPGEHLVAGQHLELTAGPGAPGAAAGAGHGARLRG